MADTPLSLSNQTGWTESGAGISGSGLNTGDLRRKYNFGAQVSELSIAQDPFFRFVSQVGKSPTDDPEFKFTEKRPIWNKRYTYVLGHLGTNTATGIKTTGVADATLANVAKDNNMWFYLGTDYLSAGNISNVIGQFDKKAGDAGTRPTHLLPNQVLRINTTDAAQGGNGVMKDYILYQIVDTEFTAGWLCNNDSATDANAGAFLDAEPSTTADIAAGYYYEVQRVKTQCVKAPNSAANAELAAWASNVPIVDLSSIAGGEASGADLEPFRVNVAGTSYEEGSSLLGDTWSDQPYSTGSGLVQTFRDEFGMTNKSRATVLKYDGNEFARIWRDHLIAHKWDLEQAGLFSSQGKATIGSKEYWYTQGAVDYILNYGNVFSLETTTKTQDDFLDDMSRFMDPRYNNSNATVFFCDTATYNWLHKLGGYFANNAEISTNFRADMAITGKKKVMGVDITTISTPYGDMNVARNVHLDGSHVKILGINMKYVKYRPLVGNGINRDTSVYVGVQTLENSGIDKRVDMLLTEAGYEWSMPEAHVMWK